jgi:hypothetical protein
MAGYMKTEMFYVKSQLSNDYMSCCQQIQIVTRQLKQQQYPPPHAGMLERLWMLNCKLTNISPAVWKLWSRYESHG